MTTYKLEVLASEIENAAQQRGFDDAVHRMVTILSGAICEIKGLSLVPISSSRPRKGAGERAVHEAVKLRPGSRGADVTRALERSVKERTVRTSLRRLREKGKIVLIEGLWYPAKDTPTP